MQKKNKGEVVGQVFIYITAVIVFAVVLIFGYSAITDFLDKGEKVAYITFKTDLENAVKNIYADYGSVVEYDQKNQLNVPSKYKKVCFIDLDENLPTDGFCDEKPIICDAWQSAGGSWSGGDQNIFLEPLGLSPIKVYQITVDTNGDREENDAGYLCLPVVQGRIEMRLEGKGDHTFISRIE